MTLLTRDALCSSDFLSRLGVPEGLCWTREAIDGSREATLRTRPPGPLWVFAYGSLMWNPLLDFDAREVATVHGWHRSFCLRMLGGRASQERPGRMLALEPGGTTQGVALRLREDLLRQELHMLWTREMVTGAYCPRWLDASLADGQQVTVLAFVAQPTGHGFEEDATVATVAPLIAAAHGPLGSNADYVHQLAGALAASRLDDPYIAQIAATLAPASTA